MPDAEGRALIETRVAHATERQFIYIRRWRAQDLVIRDDRCTIHRGSDYDMQRATVAGAVRPSVSGGRR